MNKAIIVDLDGALANIDHRKHFLEGEKKDWDSFNEAFEEDEVNAWCKEIIERFGYGNPYFDEIELIFVSGRWEKYRDRIINWLMKNNIPLRFLYLRKDNDFRKDSEIKKEIYLEKIKDNFDILFVLDDRKQVVDMWRSLGLVSLQCDVGEF